MKEFKFRITTDVSDLEAQFKGGAAELAKFAKSAAKAENQLEQLKQTSAYLEQMDKALSLLSNKHPDIFNKIFGNVDAQMKEALRPLAKMPAEMLKLFSQVGAKLDGIKNGKIDATNSEIKEIGKSFQAVAKAMNVDIDFSFLDGTDKAKVKVDKLIDSMGKLVTAYYEVNKAAVNTHIESIVPEATPKKVKQKNTVKKTVKPEPIVETISYDELLQTVKKAKDLSKKIDEGDDDAFDEMDKIVDSLQKKIKLSEDAIGKLDFVIQDLDLSVEATMDKLQTILGDKFPSAIQESKEEVKELIDVVKSVGDDLNNVDDIKAGTKATEDAADAAKRRADEEERARNAARQLKEIKDVEVGAFYNSKTGKISSVTKGDKNSVTTNLSDFQDAAKSGYDTRIHSHPYDVAVPSISSTENDFNAWLQVFDYIRKQTIKANKEVLTFDFSSLAKETVQEIANKYKELSTSIIEDFSHPTPEKVQKWGGYKNIDEEMQRQLREVLDTVMNDYPGVMSSAPFEINQSEIAIESLNNTLKDTSGAEKQVETYEELIVLLKEYQDLERSKKKFDDSSYDLYNNALHTVDKYGRDNPQDIMKAFNDVWKERKALKDNYLKSPEFIDPESGASVARKEEIAQKEKEIKQLAAAYVYLGGSVDDFKSKEKQAFAEEVSNTLQEQREQMQKAEADIDSYNKSFRDRQREIAKMLKADGTDIDNTSELIYNVENFKSVEESAQRIANVLGIEIPQAADKAEQAMEGLGNKSKEINDEIDIKEESKQDKQVVKTGETVSSSNVQAEIDDLERLGKKITEVKSAIDLKTNACVNEKAAVSSSVESEITDLGRLSDKLAAVEQAVKDKTAAFYKERDAVAFNVEDEVYQLETLRQKLEAIAAQVQTIGTINIVEQQSNKPQALEGEPLNGEQIGFDLDKKEIAADLEEATQAAKELEVAEEKVNDSLDEQVLSVAELAKQRGTLNRLLKDSKDSEKVMSSKWSDKEKEGYEQLIELIIAYKKEKRKLTDEELKSVRDIVDSYKLQAKTRKQAQKSEENAAKAFGRTELKSANKSKNNLEAIAQNFDSKAVTIELDKMRNAYIALSEAQKKFNDGHKPTDEERIAYQALTNQYNDAAKALDNLFKASKKMSENNRWIKPIGQDDLAGDIEETMKKVIRSSESGRIKFGQFRAELNELDYTVRNSNGTWSHFTASVDQAGLSIVGLNGKIKTTNGLMRDFFSGTATKFKNAMQVFSGYDLFFEGMAQAKQGIQYVREIDSALTELKKVTNETDEAYAQFLQTASQTANVVGSTVKDITTMTADWARLGYTMREATSLAQNTAVLLNVSEFTDATQASEALISTIQAFGYAADESIDVVDVLNEVGKFIAQII